MRVWTAVATIGLIAAVDGSAASFRAVKEAVWSDPYEQLPQIRVALEDFGPPGSPPDNRLRAAAARTLRVQDDLYAFPEGRKLLQANGICFAGRWRTGSDSPYTGLFAPHTTARLIARASVALSGTKLGDRRAFGIAVKLFRSADTDDPGGTANFFVMDTLAGTRNKRFVDRSFDNEPDLGSLWGAFATLHLGSRIRADLEAADRQASGTSGAFGYRPVTHLAETEAASHPPHAPHWLRLRIEDGTPRIDADDFRNELDLASYPNGRIVWVVEGADLTAGGKERAEWIRLGEIELEESVVSRSCDARLHFAHPALD